MTQTNVVAFPRSAKPVDQELQRYRLPKVKAFRDRLGRIKAYGRAAGIDDVKLPTTGFREFLDAYGRFMASVSTGAIVAVTAKKPKPAKIKSGTVRAAIDAYTASDMFKVLAKATADSRRRILAQLADKDGIGDGYIADWDREMIQGVIDRQVVTVQKNWRSAFRGLCAYALAEKMVAVDPSERIKAKVAETDGFRTWTEDEIAKYLAAHPVGTKPRLVFALALCTGQRRGDLAVMGWRHVVEGGRIKIKQSKTGEWVSIPILPELAAELAFCPKDVEKFIGIGPNYLSNSFCRWRKEAGLDDGLSLHGLRRAMCRRLVRVGMKPHQIMSITGHKTLEEVQRYCADYENEALADEAMAAIEKHYGAAA
jgi:integrase